MGSYIGGKIVKLNVKERHCNGYLSETFRLKNYLKKKKTFEAKKNWILSFNLYTNCCILSRISTRKVIIKLFRDMGNGDKIEWINGIWEAELENIYLPDSYWF